MLDPWRGRFGLNTNEHTVTSRGNERKAIFREDTDREKFLELTGRGRKIGGLRSDLRKLLIPQYKFAK
jgi:hypothetical protein